MSVLYFIFCSFVFVNCSKISPTWISLSRLKNISLKTKVTFYPIHEPYINEKKHMLEDDNLIDRKDCIINICGSLYLVGALRSIINQTLGGYY